MPLFDYSKDVFVRLRYAVFTPFPRPQDQHIAGLVNEYDLYSFLLESADKVNLEDKRLIAEILWYLSKIWSPCSYDMMRDERLVALLKLWMQESDEELVGYIAATFPGLAWPTENRELFMASSLLTVVVDTLKSRGGNAQRFACTTIMILANLERDANQLIYLDVHEPLVDLLRSAPENPADWGEGWNYSVSRYPYCLSSIMKLSQWTDCREVLKATGVIQVVSPMSHYHHIGGLLASIILAFLIGSEEKAEYTSLMNSNDAIIDSLIELLENTVYKRGDGKYYNFGYFTLEMILHACYNISLSDWNRSKLATPHVRQLLQKVLEEFDFDSNKYSEFALTTQLLLQLSFIHEDNQYLRSEEGFFAPSSGIATTLNTCKSRIKSDYDVSFLNKMLSRASEKKEEVTGQQGQQHIMLSYCWNNKAKPQLVQALGEELRKMNYEVWRDVEGSALLGPMSGSTDDIMAEAVEKSYMVVICVSKEYKNSSNCRMEANYSNQRRKQSMPHFYRSRSMKLF